MEKTDNNNINNKNRSDSNFIENKDDGILELSFKFKFLDEEGIRNEHFHWNIKKEWEDI